tara:strand:+ start:3113 stop:3592 length:480 start_codon:yes stop_codon:yes gene_type:complete
MTELWIKIEANSRPTIIAEGGEENLTLKDMQGAVGGLIEYCTFGRNVKLPVPNINGGGFIDGGGLVMAEIIDVIAHEEGRIYGEEPNLIGTYAAFGVPAKDAPYPIVGNVLVHVRIPEEPQPTTIEEMLLLVMGIKQVSHMVFPSGACDDANYEMKEEE